MFEHTHAYNQIKADILTDLGNMITNMANSYPANVSMDEFIVIPNLLSDGGCIGLTNKVLRPSRNTFRLMVLETDPLYTLVAYVENKDQLSATTVVELSEEQQDEIREQVRIIAKEIPGATFPMLFGVVVVETEVPGAVYRNRLPEPASPDPDVAPAPVDLQNIVINNNGPTPIDFRPVSGGGN